MTNFHVWLEDRYSNPKTIAAYAREIEKFATWFKETNGEPLSPQSLTQIDIRDYRQHHLAVSKSKPATVNRMLAAIRIYTKWAKETGQTETDAARNIKGAPEEQLAPQWLDRKGQRDLLQAAEMMLNSAKSEPARWLAVRDQAIINLLLHTGLRVSELTDLDLDDLKISPKKGLLTVRQGKGEKSRKVPVNSDARSAVSEWLDLRGREPGPLFTGRRGNSRLTASGVHRRVVELGKIKGLEIHAHTLRHTFAKNLLDVGEPLNTISKLLGHSKLETTKIYTMPGERDLEKAVDKVAWV
jgi:site-specific recombinase XerD